MNTPQPQRLTLEKADAEYLQRIASLVLGNSSVAATTARGLSELGFDATRVDALIPKFSTASEVGGYVFKKVEPDSETPDNFGLFVRRVGGSASPFPVASAVPGFNRLN